MSLLPTHIQENLSDHEVYQLVFSYFPSALNTVIKVLPLNLKISVGVTLGRGDPMSIQNGSMQRVQLPLSWEHQLPSPSLP